MLITNGTVFFNDKFCKLDIRVEDGKIAEIAEPGKLQVKDGEDILQAEGKKILPGLVDIHSHGRAQEDFSFSTKESLQTLCDSYAACGVTSVLATTMTNAPEAIEASIKAIGEYRNEAHMGAKIAGVFMEGPFLGEKKKGAHDVQYLQDPDQDWIDKLREYSGDSLRMITVDPCRQGTEAFMQECKKNNIVVALGHTECNYNQTVAASKAGADHVTHLFNAMLPLNHREPGLVGAAVDCGMYVEMICDGFHLHPAIIRLLFAACPEKVVLISDSMQAAGCPDGEYELGGLKVYVKDKKATQEDGTIAGSTISVYDALVNCIRFGIPAEQAVSSATRIPAESVGLADQIGCIAVGRAADLLVLSEQWDLERIFIDGKEF